MKLRKLTTLQAALGVSLVVHAGLLSLRLADPEGFDRLFEDTPLEVVLVNAQTQQKPDKAQAIAQASMAGGGELLAGRATSPLPPALIDSAGSDDAQQAEQRLKELQAQQNLMLAQVKQMLASLPPLQPQSAPLTPEQTEREQKRRQLIKLLAEIERRINQENARPKKRYISPATREAVYAVYYDHLRRAIEDKGTDNFPQQNGQKLYGELTMIVQVNHNGRVLSTEVVQSSGNRVLDRRAQAIASSAGPFGRFTPEMRRQADQIAVVSRFKFTRDDTLQAKVNGSP